MEDTSDKDPNELNQPSSTEPKPKKQPTECKICAGPALYSNYGVVVCDSCKIFFRRNAPKKQDLKCHYDGQCQININNRHVCSSCRLAKCFTCGMQAELIRSPRTANTNIKPKQQINTTTTTFKDKDQSDQFSTSNLLQIDQSTLTIDQWNLISNLSDYFDEYSKFSYTQQFIEEQSQLPPKMRFKLSSIEEYFTVITSPSQLLYTKNVDFLSLCSHDRSILVHNTMKYVAGLIVCFIMRHTRAFENDSFYQSAESFYGLESMTISIRAINQLDFDDTFVKLVLVLLPFSTFNYTYYKNLPSNNLMDIKAILRIQDMYTDLTWRYLLHKYNHERTVIYFSNLIRYFFLLNDATVQASDHEQYNNMVDSLIKQTEATLTVNE